MDIDVNQLRPERAAEGWAEVTGLQPEDDVSAACTVVVDLKRGDVKCAGVEVGRRGVRVVARSVVIACGVGHVEDLGAGDEVPDHCACGVGSASARCGGNHRD